MNIDPEELRRIAAAARSREEARRRAASREFEGRESGRRAAERREEERRSAVRREFEKGESEVPPDPDSDRTLPSEMTAGHWEEFQAKYRSEMIRFSRMNITQVLDRLLRERAEAGHTTCEMEIGEYYWDNPYFLGQRVAAEHTAREAADAMNSIRGVRATAVRRFKTARESISHGSMSNFSHSRAVDVQKVAILVKVELYPS